MARHQTSSRLIPRVSRREHLSKMLITRISRFSGVALIDLSARPQRRWPWTRKATETACEKALDRGHGRRIRGGCGPTR